MNSIENPRRTRVALVMLAPLALIGSAVAHDDEGPKSPRGTYGFTLTQSCVRTPFQPPPAGGFDLTTQALLVDAELVSAYGTGKLKFGRDGALTLEEGRLTEITANLLSAGAKPVSPGTSFNCTGAHSLPAPG